jgi:hypothetical protein
MIDMMKRSPRHTDRTAPNTGVTLGRARFAKISAVEGITISKAAKARAEEADRLGLSGAERRRIIERAYRKG